MSKERSKNHPFVTNPMLDTAFCLWGAACKREGISDETINEVEKGLRSSIDGNQNDRKEFADEVLGYCVECLGIAPSLAKKAIFNDTSLSKREMKKLYQQAPELFGTTDNL